MSEDLHPGEIVIARARPGWRGFARDAMEMTVIVLVTVALLNWWNNGAFPALAEWVIWATMFPTLVFGMNALFWSADRWLLTNQRVIDARRSRSIPLASLKPVGRSIWHEAHVAGHDGTRFRLRAIPDANASLAQIEAARQSAIEKARHV